MCSVNGKLGSIKFLTAFEKKHSSKALGFASAGALLTKMREHDVEQAYYFRCDLKIGGEVVDLNRIGLVTWFILIVLQTLIVVEPQDALGEIYQWTNADGTIGVTDDPSKVPPQYHKQTQSKREEETASGDRVYYSKPAKQEPASSGQIAHDKPGREPEKKMTEEEKKREEEKDSRGMGKYEKSSARLLI